MAKGDDSSKTPTQTGSSFGGGVSTPSQTPQQNQYLTGNPSTQNNANTLWMNPSDASSSSGINGGGGAQQAQQQSQPVQNGTMLGQITAGAVPAGFDAGKWNDPNKHDPKYDVGRLVSSGASNEQIQQMLQQQYPGWTVTGGDKIRDPQGNMFDFRYASKDPQYGGHGLPAWLDQGGGTNQQAPGNSMFGQQQGQGQNQNNFLQQMFQQMMAQRQQYAGQQFNPTGGQANGGPKGGSNQPNTTEWIPTNQRDPITGGRMNPGGNPGIMYGNEPQMSGGGFTGLGNQTQTPFQPPPMNGSPKGGTQQAPQGNWSTWSTPGVPH